MIHFRSQSQNNLIELFKKSDVDFAKTCAIEMAEAMSEIRVELMNKLPAFYGTQKFVTKENRHVPLPKDTNP
jgi:hypothetical protein